MTGIGEDDLERDVSPPDYDRGSGGAPLITMPDGKRKTYARTSSLGDTLDEKSALTNWLIAKAIEGVAKDQALQARAIAVSPYEDHKPAWTKVREDAIQAGRGVYRADIGTAVHAMSERFETDPTYDPGEPYLSALQAYTDELDRLGLKSQLFECHLVNDEMKIAGTADRIVEATKPLVTPTGDVLSPGTLLIGDIKTASSLKFSLPGYVVQTAGYAGGVLYDVEANVRLPTPEINQDWGIIFHLGVDEGTCEMLWVDLEVGRFGARLANEVREWRRNWNRKSGYRESVLPVVVETAGAETAAPAEDPPSVDRNRPDIGDLEAWRAYCRERLSRIRENPDAKEDLLLFWPDGLKAPKHLETLAEAEALSAYLDKVEADHQLPFVEGQPVAEPERRWSAAM